VEWSSRRNDTLWTDAGFLILELPLFYVTALNWSNLRQSTLGMEDMSSTGLAGDYIFGNSKDQIAWSSGSAGQLPVVYISRDEQTVDFAGPSYQWREPCTMHGNFL